MFFTKKIRYKYKDGAGVPEPIGDWDEMRLFLIPLGWVWVK